MPKSNVPTEQDAAEAPADQNTAPDAPAPQPSDVLPGASGNGTAEEPAAAASAAPAAAEVPSAGTTQDTGNIEASGAPGVEIDADLHNPALDADPRAGTTEVQNRIDFNDPRKPGYEVVAEMLKAK